MIYSTDEATPRHLRGTVDGGRKTRGIVEQKGRVKETGLARIDGREPWRVHQSHHRRRPPPEHSTHFAPTSALFYGTQRESIRIVGTHAVKVADAQSHRIHRRVWADGFHMSMQRCISPLPSRLAFPRRTLREETRVLGEAQTEGLTAAVG